MVCIDFIATTRHSVNPEAAAMPQNTHDFDFGAHLGAVQASMAQAAIAASRAPTDIQLVAVSKQQPPEKLEAALAAGVRIFGENKVQEASQHWAHIKPTTPDLCLHMIGPLQTNKVSDAIKLFDVIETLDRESLALALAKYVQKAGHCPRLYIQVNTGEEPQKSGVHPADLPQFFEVCTRTYNLAIEGLMCIPPVDAPPAYHFGLLNRWARTLGLSKLSMGMSGDFETAIQCGATSVRVGSALFGARGA